MAGRLTLDELLALPVTTKDEKAVFYRAVMARGLINSTPQCCGRNAVWNETRESDGWRWRCTKCTKTIAIRKDSFFGQSRICIRQWLLLIKGWVEARSLTNLTNETGLTRTTIANAYVPLRDMCESHMKHEPLRFDRNPCAVIDMKRCSQQCVIFLLLGADAKVLLLHNKNDRYTQRKDLPIMEGTKSIYGDVAVRVPPNCGNIEPLGQCSFDINGQDEAKAFLKAKVRNSILCDKADGLCAEFNYRMRYRQEPLLVESFIDTSEIYKDQFT